MNRAGRAYAAQRPNSQIGFRKSEAVRCHQMKREASRGDVSQGELDGMVTVPAAGSKSQPAGQQIAGTKIRMRLL